MTMPGLAALRQTVAIVSNKKASERYRDSFAGKLSDLFGRSRWALTGLALETWQQDIRGHINELLRTNYGEIYKDKAVCVASICHCWMLGYSQECALPTVVICCSEPTILRRSMRVVIRHQLLKPEGFDIKGIAPYHVQLLGGSVLVSASSGVHTSGKPSRRIFSNPVADSMGSLSQQRDSALEAQLIAGTVGRNVCGVELVVERSHRKATLGGALIIDKKYYGLTVQHVLQDAEIVTESPGSTFQDAHMYDSDWAEQISDQDDDECSIDSYLNTSMEVEASARLEPEIGHPTQKKLNLPSNSESPTASKKTDDQVGIVLLENEAKGGRSTETALSAVSPVRSVAIPSGSELDWALIQLDDTTCYYNRVKSRPSDRHILAINNIKTTPPIGGVIVLTSRGNFRAKGGGSFSSLKLPHVQAALNVWAIDLEQNLEQGDSGSWVIDASSEEVYGMVVSSCAMMNEAYIIPIHAIIEDIKHVTHETDVRLATLQEAILWSVRHGNRLSQEPRPENSPRPDDHVPTRQRRSGLVSNEEDREESDPLSTSISNAHLPDVLHKAASEVRHVVSSKGSCKKPLGENPDTDSDRLETRAGCPVDGYIIPKPITCSLHLTFEGHEISNNYRNVSINPISPSSYDDIVTKAEGYVKAQLGSTALAARSVHFRYGHCTITLGTDDAAPDCIHSQSLSTHADWNDLCTVLTKLWESSGSQDIHLNIYHEYFGLLIQRVSDENFAVTKRKEIHNLMKESANGRYLPQSDLPKVASKDLVRGIITEDPTVQPAEKEIFIQNVCKRAPKLLTMCVLARMPMKCLKQMLDRGLDDTTYPLEKHCCHEDCDPDFEDLRRYDKALNAATFFRIGEHQKFSKRTVLPIHYDPIPKSGMKSRAEGVEDSSVNETESDEENEDTDKYKALCGCGAYSKVYRVRLDPAHHNLTKDKNAVFALKEFRDRPHRTGADFKKELAVLNALLKFPNEHIVSHLATWTQDGRYYMLFPYAECNLRQYMERHAFSSPTKRNVLWLLAQFLGLSNALRSIHNLSSPGTSTNILAPQQEPRMSAWHHDLKPENILYFEGLGPRAGSFKIADFGSGKVHTYHAGRGSSSTRSPNGTLTYEPPETAKGGASSRPYDVWSMGCVFSEMLIWAVHGYDSVRSFGDSREGRRFQDFVFTDDAFWQMDITGNLQRRNTVDQWLEELRGELKRRNLQTLQEVLRLVHHHMLDIDKHTRITALSLWDTLSRIETQTRVDLEAYEDDSLIGQSTPENSRLKTLSLTTKAPDRDVPELLSSIAVSKSENYASSKISRLSAGVYSMALPQTMLSTDSHNSKISPSNYTAKGLRKRSASVVSKGSSGVSKSESNTSLKFLELLREHSIASPQMTLSEFFGLVGNHTAKGKLKRSATFVPSDYPPSSTKKRKVRSTRIGIPKRTRFEPLTEAGNEVNEVMHDII